jgi:ABC-type multidrug transport system fused ATPase/permease subunit
LKQVYLHTMEVLTILILYFSMKDPVLFSVSVGENIAYGLPDDVMSKDDIIKAAKAANAHGFIISLPQVGNAFYTSYT